MRKKSRTCRPSSKSGLGTICFYLLVIHIGPNLQGCFKCLGRRVAPRNPTTTTKSTHRPILPKLPAVKHGYTHSMHCQSAHCFVEAFPTHSVWSWLQLCHLTKPENNNNKKQSLTHNNNKADSNSYSQCLSATTMTEKQLYKLKKRRGNTLLLKLLQPLLM